ncbi:MAG TPA: ABC transporter ATP-binding protein [Vicinamibacterales bacterium]|nr:ABC transporter ATP-binding protein [Vicinamibacterales bacterium]
MAARGLSLVALLRPYWRLLSIAFVAMLVQSAADLLEPWPLKVIFDYVLGSRPMPRWLADVMPGTGDAMVVLNVAAVAVIAIAAVGAVSSYTEKYLSTTVAKRVGYDLRHMLYHHVQRLSLSFYEQRQTGDMVVRLTSDIDATEDLISSAVLGIALNILTLTGMIAVMFYLDWRFSLIGLSVAPFLFVIVYRLTRRIKSAARAVKKKESELASVVQESIASARVVKAFAREDFEEHRLDQQSEESVAIGLRARSIKARLPPLVDVIVATGTCLVLWFGVRLVLDGSLTSGALLVFVLYLGKMYKPMKDLSKMADTLSKAAVGFERIAEILNVERQVRNRPGARPAPAFHGRIEFAHVRFGYSPEQSVLKDINLVVEPGQQVALVGLTGSGKSTMIGLIPRLYDALDGSISIDGRDVRAYTLDSLRRQVSFVLQEAVLFHATVAQNIAYGKPGATTEEIVRAATLANADEFISRMPKGYDALIGERGDTLSGGQRQRIAIARAIIRDAPILLLDEPSAALDPQSEELIFQGLSRLLQGKTSITIAHRLATVRRADVIFVLDDGVISERGTHDQLLANNGLYARLYRMQFRTSDALAPPVPPPAHQPEDGPQLVAKT